MSAAAAERLVVIWRVTEACQLSCGFCAYDRRLERTRRTVDPARVRRFARVLAAWQRERGPVLLTWLGGEPLTWEPLAELARELHHEVGLDLAVTTNGVTLARPAVRDHLLACYREVTISVDGIGAVHDRLRGWPGGFAMLERAVGELARAKRVSGRGPLLRVNTVLMRDNVAAFPDLCRRLASWGVEQVTFNQLGGNDRPEFHREHSLTEEQAAWLARMLPAWRAELAQTGLDLRGGAPYLARILATTRGDRLPVADCGPGTRILFIDEAGRLSPCSFTGASYGLSVDDIDGPAALAALPARWRQARASRRDPACADCHQTTVFDKFARAP